MREDLKKFMLRLASDLELLNRFVAAPSDTADEEGLGFEDQEILFSGDQRRIYLAITEQPAPPPLQAVAQQQQQPPAAGYAWAWTPWGWQMYVR